MSSKRAEHEIAHGKRLAAGDTESVWGWATPAGQRRATRRAQWIAEAAMLREGSRVLELGCGSGLFTHHFAATGAEVTALDISEDLLNIARGRALPSRVTFVCAAIEQYDAAAPFDAVIGSSVLHHLELRPALARIFQLLTPGGVMAFGEPNMLNPQIAVQKNVPWVRRRLGDSPDETAFLRGPLRRALEQTGFREVHITPRDWLHPLTPPSVISLVQSLEPAIERLPLLREFAGSLYIAARRPLN